jgi:hypothetical protein
MILFTTFLLELGLGPVELNIAARTVASGAKRYLA